jgi:hypothetical protein
VPAPALGEVIGVRAIVKVLVWPFALLWCLVTGIVGLTGRFTAVLLGLVLVLVGVLLTSTIVGAIIGIPLIRIGLLLIRQCLT